MGERYSNKRPIPKHAKKYSGGGIRIAALSFGSFPIAGFFDSFSIIGFNEHLTTSFAAREPSPPPATG